MENDHCAEGEDDQSDETDSRDEYELSSETSFSVEDEGEEQQEEPNLRYDRITADLTEIFMRDAASCLATHSKFVALGTHWGHVYVLDHQGNKIRDKEFRSHTTTVNDISIDDSGDYIASCSDDGCVSVTGLYSSELDMNSVHDFPVRAVALDPHYGRKGERQYVLGGSDRVILHENGFFRSKSTVIHSGEGPVRVIKRQVDILAWASDICVKLYDYTSRAVIDSVNRSDDSLRPDMYQCNLCWKDTVTLLIGWGKTVKICCIRNRLPDEDKKLPRKYIEITQHFQMDFIITGICPLIDDIALLTYVGVTEENTDICAQPPQLRLILPKQEEDPFEVSAAELPIRGYAEYRCDDYHLECVEGEDRLLIVSPKDIILAKPCDMDDHVDFLMDQGKYSDALIEAKQSSKLLNRHSAQEIGLCYLKFLVNAEEYSKAAALCDHILGSNVKNWENVVSLFSQQHQLHVISPYIPHEQVHLSSSVYEIVLSELLIPQPEKFLQLLKTWSCDLYSVDTVETLLLSELDPDDTLCCEAQALLDIHAKRYDKALIKYLKLRHENVFELIKDHDLVSSVRGNVVALMDINPKHAADFLITMLDNIPVAEVVQQLRERPDLKHSYLEALFVKNPRLCEDFHSDLVELYAEYDRNGLLYFLRSSNSYPLEKAMAICKQRGFHEEEVYLLGRMGNHREALRLIVEKLENVEKAIDFAAEHDDEELWEDLIAYSVDKPPFITGLLHNVGSHINPIVLISRIRRDLVIPGLRDSLIKIIQDYSLQLSLFEGFKKILVSDCASLMRRLRTVRRRGKHVDQKTVCQRCQCPVIFADSGRARSVIVCYNNSVYHESCLPAIEDAPRGLHKGGSRLSLSPGRLGYRTLDNRL